MEGIKYDLQSLLGPGTGGLMTGMKFANDQQQTQAQTANFLEQIASSQQSRDQNAQLHPLKMKLEQAKLDELPMLAEEKRLKNREQANKLKRENATAFVDSYLRFGKGDGSAEDAAILGHYAKEFEIPEGHPIVGMLQKAYQTGGPKAVEQVKNYIAGGGMANREQRTRELAVADRTAATQLAITDRTLAVEDRKDARHAASLAQKAQAAEEKAKVAIKVKDAVTGMQAATEAKAAALEARDMQAYARADALYNISKALFDAQETNRANRGAVEIPGSGIRPFPAQHAPAGGQPGQAPTQPNTPVVKNW
jgi:hypothetical protein